LSITELQPLGDLVLDPRKAQVREAALAHLWQYFPHHCVIMTDPRSRLAINVALLRAERHGFRDPAEVSLFVGLMVFLGGHFDEDFQLPWAGALLQQTAGLSRREAMAQLLKRTTERMEPVVGRRGGYYRRALARLSSTSFEALAAAYDDSDPGLRAFLGDLHRRKLETLSEESVDHLLGMARSSARYYGLTTPAGTLLYLALMFLLGSFIDRDPFHPWAGEILRRLEPADPDLRSHALYTEAMDHLRRFTRLDRLMGNA
jgi:hypothetical protein